jgi:uncharacterized protein
MGLNSLRVYFDSCVLIYLIEEHPIFAPFVETLLAKQPDIIFQVSGLTEMECLVIPLRNNNQFLIEKYHQWFERNDIIPNEREVYQQAAQLRADHKSLKTPDAIHLATALHYGCDERWTNDDRLGKIAPAIARNILAN